MGEGERMKKIGGRWGRRRRMDGEKGAREEGRKDEGGKVEG